MTDKNTITLPRKVVEFVLKHLEWWSDDEPQEKEAIEALRTALAAEQQKPEPVAWLSRDEARLALWKAINSREFGNPTDDKLILDHLRQQGLWIGKVTSPAPPEDEALRRDAERLTDEQIDSATSKERDDLLDHIYEYGTAAEGILERIRKLARAAIDAAMEDKR